MTRPVVVLGDCTLDVDVSGVSTRLSPEAPVPVISEPVEVRRPGGAALAALLLAREHPRVVLVTPLGDDDAAGEIRALLDGVVEVVALPTTATVATKTRIRIGDHPVARVDTGGEAGQAGPLPAAALDVLAGAEAVLVSDYGRGAAGLPDVRRELGRLSCPLVWDPHPRGSEPVGGVWLATPNLAEAAAAAGTTSTGGVPTAARLAADLVRRWSARAVAVTLGSGGALLSTGSGAPLMCPAEPVDGGDTCGAGDAFAAAATAALARGALPSEAVVAAVTAAGAFVRAGGAAAVGRVAVSPTVRDPDEDAVDAVDAVERVRAAGGTVVATGGCFDLLHAGHLSLLESARALGDLLVVCLNSDDSVRRLKGPDRPLQDEYDRAAMLRSLRCVDAVLVFDEDTPAQALARLRPDVWVKGGDYTGEVLPEAAQLAAWGAEAVTVPFLPGRSTTRLARRAAGAR